MKQYILITGASSGIGYEMAQQLAALEYNLILTARNEDKLLAMQQELTIRYGIDVHYIPKDLGRTEQAAQLFDDIKRGGYQVSHLVNNAGLGDYGSFLETSLEKELEMIDLNISSLVILTKLFAKDMAARKSGRIMNVSSVLAYLPFPYMSVYSATKAFVLAFSQTLAAELEGTGVVVTTLAPGTTETAFVSPEMRETNLLKSNKPTPVKTVATEGVNLLLHGKGKKIVGFQNRFNSILAGILPDSVMMKVKMKLASAK
ncbi:short-subunit dehydrogenase [Pedobacter sp. W3I1]|uniref:SDR family NAD(P)-dependent oxidoreductase n=1 Tax=Pedobacter sp. W3I1 TaxID=3042291 RepID=UPI00278344D5|nr:SDR family oxidoreductase [Pedobacter sp. W3I1]MDQ0641173.1 short-subunit dehydrogenase [Pedobacter sp. W3I1]